ncbi:unnamed protein product [Ectocarpus fasciculatus]
MLERSDTGAPSVVRVLSRDAAAATSLFAHVGLYSTAESARTHSVVLEVVEGSVEDPSSLVPLLSGATRLFLLTLTSLGARQRAVEEGVLGLLGLPRGSGAAVGASVIHIVRLSAHARGMEGQPSNSPFRWHSECDEQLLQMCDRSRSCGRGVAVTLLRPSLFMQDMTRRHFAPVIVEEDKFYQLGLMQGGCCVDGYRIAMVDSRDIADVAATVLSQPVSAHAGNTYILSGPRALSWRDVAEAITAVCGRPVQAHVLSDKAFFDRFGRSHVYLKQMQAYRAGCGEDVDGDIEVVTGKPARSIDSFCQDYASAWKKPV